MQIVPSILTYTFTEFERQVHRMENLFDYIQIDVMDGQFVETVSFPEVDKVPGVVTPLRYELHLMVQNPVAEMRKWQNNDKVFRVLFHVEANDPRGALNFAKKEGWEIGMVLNPETPLATIEPYVKSLDAVQFMTVNPGKQGNPFLPKVLDKIKLFTSKANHPLCLVDGAVNKNNIKSLAEAGVDIVCPGSVLCRAEDVERVLEELKQSLTQ